MYGGGGGVSTEEAGLYLNHEFDWSLTKLIGHHPHGKHGLGELDSGIFGFGQKVLAENDIALGRGQMMEEGISN